MTRARRIAFLVLVVAGVVSFVHSGDAQPPPEGTRPVDRQAGQRPPPGPPSLPPWEKHILVVGAALGFQHDSITDGMVAIRNMGQETGLWHAWLRTDYEWITKEELRGNRKNLDDFDALVFVNTTGAMELDEEQKQALLSFVHDEGKGFVGVHAAADANYEWPEYGEMIGGYFDAHPWNTFDAPIVLEDPSFPAVQHFPQAFMKRDEIYQFKAWSRDEMNVLLRLDETKIDLDVPRISRTDRDFAVAWSKMYGNGRVFYSTLGHTNESWTDPDVTTMYFEAIKWALGLTEGSTAPHPKPTTSERTSP